MISLIDYSMVEQARFIRNVLECAVVEHLCRTIAPGEIEAHLKTIDIHAYVLKHDDSDALCELDNAFHQMLFDLSKKQQAYDMIRWMSIHFDRVRSLSLRAVKEIKIVEDHRTIVDAIAWNDAGEARKIMDRHLSRYRIDEQVLRQRHPGFFSLWRRKKKTEAAELESRI